MSDVTLATVPTVCEQEELIDAETLEKELHATFARTIRSCSKKIVIPAFLGILLLLPLLPITRATETFVVRGYEIVRCDPSCVLFLLLPWLLAGVVYSDLSDSAKTILELLCFLLHALASFNTLQAVREWCGYLGVRANLTVFFTFYTLFFLFEAVLAYLISNPFREKG